MSSRTPGAGARFRPRFTLGILYVAAFFFLYALLLALPALFEVWREVPAGPEQEELARQAAYQATRGRLPIALLAALVTVGLGVYARVLPGMRGEP